MSQKLRLAVLGSTGSIGTQTLEIVRTFPDHFEVVCLSAGKNVKLLRSQILEFCPQFISVESECDCELIRKEFPNMTSGFGDEGLKMAATLHEVDVVVMGIMGFKALSPTINAIRSHKKVALASKEVLVVAGNLIQEELKKTNAFLIPIDSEHSALFQLLEKVNRDHVASLILTASGGPLFKKEELPLCDVTPEIAVKHPNWKMGAKISVDSATLMNKGLELIEAHYLFNVPQSQIEVWIHPQSIIHGAIRLRDNSFFAQFSLPNMKSAIGYALKFPDRLADVIPELSVRDLQNLEFFAPDEKRFPALRIAREAMESGPSYLVTLNAVNECAVEAFLQCKILYSDIVPLIEEVLHRVKSRAIRSLEDVFIVDHEARLLTSEMIRKNHHIQ